MNFRYMLKETADGFKRAWGSCLLSILTIAFFLALLGFLALVSLNIDYFKRTLNDRLQLQVFISSVLDDQAIADLSQRISRIPGVRKVSFISKQMAAEEFQKEFGRELFAVLEENPLPSSFVVQLGLDGEDEGRIRQLVGRIEQEEGVDEVVYHFQTLFRLQRYARLAATVSWILVLFVTFGSLFVVSNNIRLVIAARKQIITTMQLVGATPSFIRTPLILEGTLQGMIGALLAALGLYVVNRVLSGLVPGLLALPPGALVFLVAIGSLLGFLGSLLAIKRYL
ncbi:MAG TPA: permease-like cell division protein FtsX [bacterium]|nr:permease-like cell division protein FtsX [bacterium]HQG44293.1 permease-like cell division protein FtsX [bacterium]HQI47683.1 permease-like cell division protein FtsX [bacterium]HQJ63352.1 permease-like cell division protein FtsX [bacterium]